MTIAIQYPFNSIGQSMESRSLLIRRAEVKVKHYWIEIYLPAIVHFTDIGPFIPVGVVTFNTLTN